ncbi:MAG: type I-F CRISPR-associated endoribonuclease Cas6/Csy4 [gamma proteobacterium endosymbiont of Lamellibrachia anaximandri]|nr:type I-F CRISPR-associated endoribonuclease Cas6/Csy4 [gamma proteobacterium endosymbiont of Lamellibrachia anaximandri]MBL3619207.1 type I-F CRISPR-associated endoribonuclease Cas6/Csy4 [gamma proteobacterium endosymbiont of Lamellibrachia anaximandri]
MDHYLEIRLLPDPEFIPSVLMNALFAKLHRALVELDNDAIGLSFPDMQQEQPALGDRLRLHSKVDDLQSLMTMNWLTGMRDHITTHGPNPIPKKVGYRVVRRVQAKSNPDRIRRRLIKRKGITEVEARCAVPDSAAKKLKLPFVTIKSQSTGQEFRLFIEHQPVRNESVVGEFSCYGLSPTATVPWF